LKLLKDPKKRKPAPAPYRHIEVEDRVDKNRRTRTLIVTCPLEYPGLSERERRRMYEGLGMVADAFRDADERIAKQRRR
jgi:hypothetical protein